MSAILTAEVLQDDLAISLACAITAANKKAREIGVDILQSMISVTQQELDDCSVWRVNYGAKYYINQRGGDVLIEVDMLDASIKRVLRGQ